MNTYGYASYISGELNFLLNLNRKIIRKYNKNRMRIFIRSPCGTWNDQSLLHWFNRSKITWKYKHKSEKYIIIHKTKIIYIIINQSSQFHLWILKHSLLLCSSAPSALHECLSNPSQSEPRIWVPTKRKYNNNK